MGARLPSTLRLAVALLGGLAMAALLLAGLAWLLHGAQRRGDHVAAARTTAPSQGPKPASRLQFLPSRQAQQRRQPAPLPPKTPPAELPDGQVVETARPEREQAPAQARYLGRYDMAVARETKATGRRSRGDDMGRVQIDKPSALQSPQSDSREPTTLPEAARPRQLSPGENRPSEAPRATADGPGAAPPPHQGQAGQGSVVVQGAPNGLLLPSTSTGNVLRNLQALSGSGGSNDHLPDVDEEGDTNLLNTRKFRYWDFFQRIKDRVSQEWEPARVWRSHDPNGQRFGVKNRLTVLKVTLDPEGALKHLRVAKESGLEFLDDEARRAFSAASPFPNPPAGLRNGHGEIEFQFGFLFEISTQRFRMRGWQ